MAVRVETLGGLRVWRETAPDEWAELPEITGKPVRLAVLLTIAVERDVTRERVADLFWPGDPRARNNLRETLRQLGRDLGPEVFERPGQKLIAPDDLRVDILEFERACQEDRFDDVGSLYQGPFLAGVGLPTAIEPWVEERRMEFAMLFRRAQRTRLSELVQASRWSAALAVARSWVTKDHWEDDAHHRLIELLARMGMRNEALRHYESYRDQLASEFEGSEPRRDTSELVEGLRQGRVTIEAPRDLHPREARVLEAKTGVVVFPFLDRSEDGSRSNLCEGLADDVITELGRSGSLRVTPRTSAFALGRAGLPLREAARQLGVTHVLEGSARFAEGWFHVTARLIEATTESRVWEAEPEGPLDSGDLSGLARRIATSVLELLDPSYAPTAVSEPSPQSDSDSVEASLLYNRGRVAWHSRTSGGFVEALEAFTEGIRLRPNFAAAHAAMADAYNLMGAFDYAAMAPTVAYPRALEAARRALELDPELAQAHAALGNTLMSFERDFARAEDAFRTSIRLEHSYSPARQWYSTLLVILGRGDEALRQATLAREFDPQAAFIEGNLGRIHRLRGEPEEAWKHFENSIRMSEKFVKMSDTFVPISDVFVLGFLGRAVCEAMLDRPDDALATLQEVKARVGDRVLLLEAVRGYALARAGQIAQARRVAAELRAAGRDYLPAEYVSLIYVGMGELDEALTWLERASEARSQVIIMLPVEPLVDPLRGHARFDALLQ